MCAMNADKVKIKKMLREVGISQTEIARMLKVSSAAVSYVISGKKRTPRIRKAVAFAVRAKLTDLWPE